MKKTKTSKKNKKFTKEDLTEKLPSSQTDVVYDSKVHHNDPTWYNDDPTSVRDTANMWFDQPAGPLNQDIVVYQTQAGTIPRKDIIMKANTAAIVSVADISTPGPDNSMVPTGANDLNSSDAINLAGMKLFQTIKAANSRDLQYQANDVIKEIFQAANVYRMLMDGFRFYGLIRHFDIRNKAVPASLISACGWKYDTSLNLPDFRFRLNRIISIVNKWNIPSFFNYIPDACSYLGQVFTDAPDKRAQFICVRRTDWSYIDTTGEMRFIGELDPASYSTAQAYVNAYFSRVENAVLTLTRDTFFGIIGADLIKAFGEAVMVQMPQLTEDYETPFNYDEEFLSKWRNATIISNDLYEHIGISISFFQNSVDRLKVAYGYDSDLNGSLVISDNYDHVQPDRAVAGYWERPIIYDNFNMNDQDPLTIVVNTRLMALWRKYELVKNTTHFLKIPRDTLQPIANVTSTSTNQVAWIPYSCGTHLFGGMRMYLPEDYLTEITPVKIDAVIGKPDYIWQSFYGWDTIEAITKYDVFPTVYGHSEKSLSSGSENYYKYYGRLTNWATIPTSRLTNVHYVANNSLFADTVFRNLNIPANRGNYIGG